MNCQMRSEIPYVCGFAFFPEAGQVALIRKNRGPEFNVGKWNGICGKIEASEGIRSAQSREFEEKTGVLVPNYRWACYHTEKHLARGTQQQDPRIHFLAAWLSEEEFSGIRSTTDEEVQVFDYRHSIFAEKTCAYNLNYLIPMALVWLLRPEHRWIEG